MAGLDPAIHVFGAMRRVGVDARVKPGHDDCFCGARIRPKLAYVSIANK